MKKLLTAKTRWEYYAANIAGMIILVGLIILCMYLSFDEGHLNFKSISVWLALLMLLVIPFSIISFFSSMKEVVITDKGFSISYAFKSHTSQINFSDVVAIKSRVKDVPTTLFLDKIADSFSLQLEDGRVFEFSRSQFDNYAKMKSIAYKAVTRKK